MFNAVKFVFNINFLCSLLPFIVCWLLFSRFASSSRLLFNEPDRSLFLIVPAQMFCGFCGKFKLPRRRSLSRLDWTNPFASSSMCVSITKIGFVIDLRHQNQLMRLSLFYIESEREMSAHPWGHSEKLSPNSIILALWKLIKVECCLKFYTTSMMAEMIVLIILIYHSLMDFIDWCGENLWKCLQ